MEQQEVWRRMYQYLTPKLEHCASRFHLHGVRRLEYDPQNMPGFLEFSELIESEMGWHVVEAQGELGAFEFFSELANFRFPAVRRVRPLEQIYGGIDPDFWHEAFGHIPSLMEPKVTHLYL